MARWTLAVLALGAAPGALAAQTPAPAAQQPAAAAEEAAVDTESEAEEIVVTGRPPPGSVPGDIKPELQLSPADIRSYGVSSVSELLSELAPQLQSVRGGEPVILVNGRRSAGLQEIRDFPPEALLRVDILPEEVALKFGYRSDQKVINFVLRPRFRSYTAELEGSAPTQGGSSNFEAEGGLVRIDRDKRLNVNLQAETTSNLLESERGITPDANGTPFDLIGNVTSTVSGGAIDPALTAAVGRPVTVAAVPTGAATIAGFAAGADSPRVTDTTPFRTLNGAVDRFSANAVYARSIFGNVAATATARVEHSRTEALLGLPGVSLTLPGGSPFSPFTSDVLVRRYTDSDALLRNGQTTSANAGVVLNGDIGRWRWSLNGDYTRNETTTRTERGVDIAAVQSAVRAGTLNPFGDLGALIRTADRANSVSSAAGLNALVAGSPFSLPAGDVNTSIRVAASTNDFSSDSRRGDTLTSARIGRDAASVRANIDLPIANAARDILAPLGRLSLNGNVEVEQLSDFGTLTTLGYGINWQPVTPIRIIANFTTEENAPSQQLLGSPIVVTPFVRLFDFVRGVSVDTTTIGGGNPTLMAENRRSFKLSLNIRPWLSRSLSIQADYIASRNNNPIQAFPPISDEVETAFPERFVRDNDGTLIRFDQRSVNFLQAEENQLRWGINYSKRVETERSRAATAQRAARMEARQAARYAGEAGIPTADDQPTPGLTDRLREFRGTNRPDLGRGLAQGGERGFGGANSNGGRLFASVYHTWVFTDKILIRSGLPRIDRLNGSAANSNGGTPRHRLQFNGGYNQDGKGVRLAIDWRQGTRVNQSNVNSQPLDFGSRTTTRLGMWINLGQQPELANYLWIRGLQLDITLDNIFNNRQRVSDANGTVPFRFQPGFMDAQGRVIMLKIRKLIN